MFELAASMKAGRSPRSSLNYAAVTLGSYRSPAYRIKSCLEFCAVLDSVSSRFLTTKTSSGILMMSGPGIFHPEFHVHF
eukprot:1221545-Ditylum_brightwellii.AAC.1